MSSYEKKDITLNSLRFNSLDLLDIIRAIIAFLFLLLAFLTSTDIINDISISFYLWLILVVSYFAIIAFKYQYTDNKFLYLLYHSIFFILIFIVVIIYCFDEVNSKALLLIGEEVSILMIMMFTFVTIPKKSLVFLYQYILNYKFYDALNTDFYINSLDYDIAIDKNKLENKNNTIFIINTKVNQSKDNIDSNFEELKQYYAKLIYFWYARKFEKVLLRFILPLWSVVFGILFFIITLLVLDNIDDIAEVNSIRMGFVVLFLTILFMSMIYQINNTLDARGYMQHINRSFKKFNINFKDIKPAQRVLLFFDRTFMVYIYDTKFDRRIVLNDNKSFERFILKADLDKEGRDNIASIFVTLFIVVYIEIFVQVLSDSKTDLMIKDINKTLSKIERKISN